MKEIKIPKDYFKGIDFKVTWPTIVCKICGKEILDTPSNRVNYLQEYEDWVLTYDNPQL